MNNFNVRLESEYKVNDIIAELRKNKDAHVADYKKAMEVYLTDLLNCVENFIKKIESGKMPEYVSNNFGLSIPQNNESSYLKMIKIFSMMQVDNVKLSMEDANAIFNDEWSWLATSKLINSSYSSRGKF